MNISLSLNTRSYRIAVSAFFFIAGITVASWAGRIPDIKETLHLSDAGLGAVLFALPVGQLISLPLAGWLISKYGSKNIVVASALILPLSLLSLAVTGNVWQLATTLALFGMVVNLTNISMNTQAVGVEKLYGRSVMASFHGLWSLSGFAGAAIAGFFVAAGVSTLVHFSIIAALICCIVLAAYRFTLPDELQSEKEAQPLFVKPDRYLLMLGLIAFCCMVCEGAMADWSGVYFKTIVQSPINLVTAGYIAFMGSMATGRFLGDALVTKFGIKHILQASGLMIASGLLTVILLPYVTTAIAGCLLTGIGVSCVVPIVFGLAGKSAKMPAGLALTAVSTIGFLGFLAGPPLIGFIAQASNLRWSFVVIAVLGLGTTLMAGKIKNSR